MTQETVSASGESLKARMTRVLRSPAFLATACVLLAVIVANAIYIVGFRTNNPLFYFSGLTGPTGGSSHFTIDPNLGWTSQTLGHLSAESWLHGHVPLWNSYEGLGQPLAGEMQSAAFFLPFTLLLGLSNGIFVFHLVLEMIAGIATLLLLRSLKLSWLAATCGACLFALNGSFAVMANAPVNPIAFLPAVLWGVELVARAVREGRRPRAGMWVIGLSAANMLFAGFPETAYLELLFVGAWVLMRLAQLVDGRVRFGLWTLLGVLVGVAIAAPVLVAFKDFLDFGYTSYHSGHYTYSYNVHQTATFAIPFATGDLANSAFTSMAGYITVPAVLMALIGLAGRGRRALRIFACVVVGLLVANMLNIAVVHDALNLIPGMRNTLLYKYGLVLIEFVVALCAAYGIDDLRRAVTRRRNVATAGALVALYVVGVIAWLAMGHYITHAAWTVGIVAWTAATCCVLLFVLLRASSGPRRPRVLGAIAALVLIVDAAGMFMVPELRAGSHGAVDMAPVHFLQANLGTSRFYTVSPLSANYGSYWGIAQLNANDLPVPKKYAHFLQDRLRPAATPRFRSIRHQFGGYTLVEMPLGLARQRLLLQAYAERQQYFRSASVKYVLASTGAITTAQAAGDGLTLAFGDKQVQIWEDAKAAPYYTTVGGTCAILSQTRSAVSLHCAAPAVLTRHELSSPGWSATINHRSVTVADPADRTFQSVPIPAGDVTVTFSYVPPYFVSAAVLSLAVLALMLLDGLVLVLNRRRAALIGWVGELLPHRYRELAKFVVVGGLAWFVDVGLFTVLAHGALSNHVIAAKVTSILVATLVSYVANRQWSFNTRGGRKTHHEAVLFFLVNALALVVNLVPLWLSHYVFGFNASHYSHTLVSITDFVSANVIGNVLALVFRYWAYRRFVFPDEIGHVGEDDSRLEPHSLEAQMRGLEDS